MSKARILNKIKRSTRYHRVSRIQGCDSFVFYIYWSNFQCIFLFCFISGKVKCVVCFRGIVSVHDRLLVELSFKILGRLDLCPNPFSFVKMIQIFSIIFSLTFFFFLHCLKPTKENIFLSFAYYWMDIMSSYLPIYQIQSKSPFAIIMRLIIIFTGSLLKRNDGSFSSYKLFGLFFR